MKTLTRSLTCLLVGAATLVATGCGGKDEPTAEKPKMKPAATMPTTTMASKAPATPAAPALKAEDMTHVVDMDTPMFETMSNANVGKPMGMMKKGEKVVVMMPRGKFAQVTTAGGNQAYVATAALKPMGK